MEKRAFKKRWGSYTKGENDLGSSEEGTKMEKGGGGGKYVSPTLLESKGEREIIKK